jgi:hypothetical protein
MLELPQKSFGLSASSVMKYENQCIPCVPINTHIQLNYLQNLLVHTNKCSKDHGYMEVWNCMCTVELFLAMYSRMEESLMGNAHELSTVAYADGTVLVGWITQPANAHGKSLSAGPVCC